MIFICIILGFVIGLILAGAFAFGLTMLLLHRSNNIGDSEGTYTDFTGSKMQFISTNRW